MLMLNLFKQTILRNVSTMAATKAPAEPLVVVLGSTGTGKSDVSHFMVPLSLAKQS